MKKNTWYKHHKWIGIVVSFFLLMFCISGLILNHPTLFSNCNISRSWLPKRYQYDKWNLGLLRGSIKWHNKVLVYGNSGIWRTDTTANQWQSVNFDDFILQKDCPSAISTDPCFRRHYTYYKVVSYSTNCLAC